MGMINFMLRSVELEKIVLPRAWPLMVRMTFLLKMFKVDFNFFMSRLLVFLSHVVNHKNYIINMIKSQIYLISDGCVIVVFSHSDHTHLLFAMCNKYQRLMG